MANLSSFAKVCRVGGSLLITSLPHIFYLQMGY